MNPDYMHWNGWTPMKETLQKNKDEAEKIKAEKTLPLHIIHRGIRIRRGFDITSEPATEAALHYEISSLV